MIRHRFLGVAALLATLSSAVAAADNGTTAATATQSGIALDVPWKAKLYGFAREKLRHPAWGWTHSERDYHLALAIAASEGLAVDGDILFAASFAHDIGAIGDFQKAGVDHAQRSVEVAEAVLRDMGFPMTKWPAVKEAILGHMHDKPAGRGGAAIVLHDADTLDFLGTVGVARRLSVTGDAADYSGGVARIREFADTLPERLVTRTAKNMAPARVAEMKRFLAELDAETAGGRLP